MSDQTTNYQCPACTGPLHFDGASGKLVCDYCGSSYSIEEIDAAFSAKNDTAKANAQAQAQENQRMAQQAAEEGWDYSTLDNQWGSDAADLTGYSCTSCGADLICDKTTAATTCPYCGNPTVIPSKFDGALKPDFVIPFKLDKNAAMEALRKHYKGKKLLPKSFASENHIQEIQGVYVPFWLYDGEAHGSMVFHGERVHVHSTKRERVTETSHYELFRSGAVAFEKIPVDASSKMDNDLMDSIEPYDYRDLKPFSMSYLPGFLADKYDVSAEDCAGHADERALQTVEDVLRSTTDGYTSVMLQNQQMQLRRGQVHYALMPVWMLTTRYQDQPYTFAMNGQTGKLMGNLPMDKGLYRKWHLIYGAAIAAVLFAFELIAGLL